MTRRHVVGLTLALVVLVAGSAGARWWWTHDRVVEAGGVLVLVEGHDLGTSSWAGVGYGGELGLIGDRCVGFVGPTDQRSSLIVWPAGTDVTGVGDDLEITTGGVTLRLGDQVEGGMKSQTLQFPDLVEALPDECVGIPLVPFDPHS